jgi:hypothetical protein
MGVGVLVGVCRSMFVCMLCVLVGVCTCDCVGGYVQEYVCLCAVCVGGCMYV